MIEATLHDNTLLGRFRKVVEDQLEKRIQALIDTPTDREAGYICGLRDALEKANEIGREMNSPQPERQ